MKRLLSLILCIAIASGALLTDVSAANSILLSAECAALMCVQTGELLYQKNAYAKHSMASTTKIMTSLLAIEEYTPHRQITVSKAMLGVEGTSMGLLPGDIVTLEGLVYGMLLQSGNDAANVTAITLGGSIEGFAERMNDRAEKIGMQSSNFVTPSGLDDPEHYSTAYDMALLGCEAVKNTEFLYICSQKSAVVYYGNPPYRRKLYNHNRLLSGYDGAVGIKTGFTQKSGRCLVSCAQRDGVTLVAVTLNAPDDWQDHRKMLDYGFSVVKSAYGEFDMVGKSVPVVGGVKDSVSLSVEPVRLVSKSPDVKPTLLLQHFLYAPVSRGQVVGYVQWIENRNVIASSPVFAGNDIPAVKPPEVAKKQSLFDKIKIYFKEKFK